MKLTRSKMMAVTMFLGLVVAAPVKATTWHVDDNAAAGGDGLSWATAFQFLQDAMDSAVEGDLVKVAQGTYHPDDDSLPTGMNRTPGDQTQSFVLKGGLLGFVLKGGYKGIVDPPNADLRDPVTFVTILSGDLDDNDVGGLTDPSRNDNSDSVVNGGIGTDEGTELDGFTIRDGHGGTNGSSGSGSGGGGMIVDSQSSPTIRNCTFTRNWVSGGRTGVGLLLDDHNEPRIEDCLFIDNEAGEGGGMTVHFWPSQTLRWE